MLVNSMETTKADLSAPKGEATQLAELSGQQCRSGIAAWLGWTFDGLDMHLYTLVYAPFVAQLLGAATWPRRWRPWLAAVLQTGVNVGILLAVVANLSLSSIVASQPRWIFVVGSL